MTASMYEQHDAAFAGVSAYVVLKDGEKVATIAFKFPRDGAGRLYAYVHWLGHQMVRGFAAGGGYDKKSAAVASAIGKLTLEVKPNDEARDNLFRFVGALEKDDGEYWDRRLAKAGFTVFQAV